ncbi:MAG: 30S ribosomal protein S8 [Candidatus Paceibacterota bacterium]|jgi:small subunit ribosomal protein S8
MDQIANMLIAIKNGGLVKKATVTLPSSKMKCAILELLKEEGYIKTYKVSDGVKPTVEVVLEYKKGSPRIQGVSRVSKQSKRVYTGVKEITPFKYGHGMTVLSTPKGILSDKQARKEMVGGELLFTIW